jgi:hydrogenase maturation protease
LEKTLIIGYGNPDREDDGVAWHVLALLWERFSHGAAPSPHEGFPPDGSNPAFLFTLQLTPELAELLADYQRVCFVDAHSGNFLEEVHLEPLTARYQASPFTHHLTPAACLVLAQALYGRKPEAVLVSVQGYQFDFSQSLSKRTEELVLQAADLIWDWLDL